MSEHSNRCSLGVASGSLALVPSKFLSVKPNCELMYN